MRGAYFPRNGSKRWLEPLLRQAFAQWGARGRFLDPFCGSGALKSPLQARAQVHEHPRRQRPQQAVA